MCFLLSLRISYFEICLNQEGCQNNFLGAEENPRLHNQTAFGGKGALKKGQRSNQKGN
jgi:hypothetical protein